KSPLDRPLPCLIGVDWPPRCLIFVVGRPSLFLLSLPPSLPLFTNGGHLQPHRDRRLRRADRPENLASSSSSLHLPPAHLSLLQAPFRQDQGAIACGQCKGSGVDSEDHFNGRFKEGAMCWLCRGKREVLCGSCNGGGFLGGFMSTANDTSE
ncbi:hypothetical protein BRADI_5g15612v3, partial [Brachypodium distachyon]